MLQAGAIVAEHLRLVRQLGSGGMGSVWIAEQTRLGGQVAVKFLSTALLDHESARSRFDREARLAAKIKSQHVVQVHDHGVTKTEPAIPYIVMELLEGTDLSKLLDRDGPLGLSKASEIMDQVCDALTKAHDAGIVHRDIKPENVFVLNEQRTFVKLLDFGVAHGKDGQLDRLTQTGLLLGTAHYMSPEQLFSGKDIDARADLWALGILTYQMLTNEVPFQAETFGQLCLQVRDGSFPAISTKVNVPPALDDWFAKALATDRANRFQTAIEMSAAFKRVVAGDTLPAGPGPVGVQTTGTGTVRVDKSEIARIRESSSQNGSFADVSDAATPPATQRFGSHSGVASAPTQNVHSDQFVVRGTASSGEHRPPSGNRSSSQLVNSGPIASSTPLAELSGSFGTEAKGVLALGPRPSESSGRAVKWLSVGLAALTLGAFGVYLSSNTSDQSAAAGMGAETTGPALTPTTVTEVIRGDVNAAPVSPTSPKLDQSVAAGVGETESTPTASEKAASQGNPASKGSENAVTGGRVLTTPGYPVSSGSPTSAGERSPKTTGLAKTPKANDDNHHASSDRPQVAVPASEPPSPPKPDPTPSRKPKYRGF